MKILALFIFVLDTVTCKDHKKVVSVGVSNHDFTDSEQQVKDYLNKSINSDGNQ